MTETETSEWNAETIDAEAYDPAQLPSPPSEPETFWSAVKSFFGGKRSRQSSGTQPLKNSTVSQQELEQMATNSSAEWAWQNMKDGSRRRIWCKTCKQEGKPWYTPEPCEHILNAKPEQHVSEEEMYRMLEAVWNEDKAQNETDWNEVNQKLEKMKQDVLVAKSILEQELTRPTKPE